MLKQKRYKLKFVKEEKKKTKSFVLEGLVGLKVLNHSFLTKNQIEAARKVINKHMKRNCKI
jgi:ribosomal protein L16/L10AE